MGELGVPDVQPGRAVSAPWPAARSASPLSAARLHRFDYQPSGWGRAIVNLVVGIVGDDRTAFAFMMESWVGSAAAYTQPDLLLERVRVLGPLPGQ